MTNLAEASGPEPTLNDLVSAELRGLLARTGLAQSALAARLHIAQPQVSKRLRGQIAWSVPELELVAPLFGMDAVDLLTRAKNNDAPHQLSGAGPLRAWRDSNPQPSDP